MRLGLVIYGSLDTLSGGYLYDRRLVEHLRARGDTVEIIRQAWRSYALRLGQNEDYGFWEYLAGARLDGLLQDELNHPSLWRGNRRLKRVTGYPIVSIVHHLRSSEQHPRLLLPLYRAVERAYLRTVDAFIFNSQTTRRSVEALLERAAPGVMAYPGGDQFGAGEEAGTDPDDNAYRHNEDLGLRLLFVGNLIPRKGLHTLLSALALLPDLPWRLQIVGRADVDPAYARQMQRLAAPLGERVSFLGRVEQNEFPRVWRENQVLVVPSTYEGFGIVYLEGMAFGLPAVATTAGAAAEIIIPGENGFLVPPKDPAALAGVLSGLAREPSRLRAMSQAARRRYRQFPTWEETGARIRGFLEQVIADR